MHKGIAKKIKKILRCNSLLKKSNHYLKIKLRKEKHKINNLSNINHLADVAMDT